MSFADDIAKFAAKTQARADLIVAKVVLDLHASVTMKSPVGDASYWASPPPKGYVGGRFRGNWQLGVDQAPSGKLNVVDPSGSIAIGAAVSALPGEAAGKVYFIVNNLPYGRALEDGHSRQAPQGMVGLTLTEFQGMVAEAVGAAR